VCVPAAFVLGILCDLEGLAMSLVMPVWRKDIKTLCAARGIRKEMLNDRSESLQSSVCSWQV
jgi:CDP-diacylglycerol--glycerol-3-phosphate 3-phosphatidyltransferase